MSAEIDPLDPERFRLQLGSNPPKPARLPFARTWLPCLTGREWDDVYPPRTRLWLLLLIKSREGRRPVRLTNKLAQEIGLDRYAKTRALARLERAGLVSVTRFEGKMPLVNITAVPGAAMCANRPGGVRKPPRCVGKSAHPSRLRNSSYLYTSSSSLNESNEG